MGKFKILLLLLVLVSACRETYIREIDFATPSKLAVSCFIKPGDTLIQLNVIRSIPVYTTNNNNITALSDAQVIIEGNGQRHNLIFQPAFGRYTATVSPTFIAEGKTYTLQVTEQNETVTASTTVPIAYTLQGQAQLSYILQSGSFGGGMDTVYGCQANFNAAPLANSLYGISYQLIRQRNGVDFPGAFYANSPRTTTFLDFLKSNQASQQIFARLNEKVRINFRNSNELYYFKVHVLQCDYSFYEFNRTADLNNRSNGEFFTEPVPVYSNIAGGLGCFGSYISYSLNSPVF